MGTAPESALKTANLMLSVFDGARQPMRADAELLVRLIDGAQNQVSAAFHHGPDVYFTGLPVHDNFRDNYTVIVSADGYRQAGFQPVKLEPGTLNRVSLMLLPANGSFNFAAARWDALAATHAALVKLLSHGAASEAAARDRYEQLMENKEACLACFFNLTSAMTAIPLARGTPFDYLVELDWDRLQQDRFFAWARRGLADEVRAAAKVFKPVNAALHPGATSSYKQAKFGEANVQLTFHENDKRTIDGEECIVVEPDIDYYKDDGAHLLLEVLPNTLTGALTDPKAVYVLRWIAGTQAAQPAFEPPYTIVA